MNERFEIVDNGQRREVLVDDLPALFNDRHPEGIEPIRYCTQDDLPGLLLTVPGITEAMPLQPLYSPAEAALIAKGYSPAQAVAIARRLSGWQQDPDSGAFRFAVTIVPSDVADYRQAYAEGERLFWESQDVVEMVEGVPVLMGRHWKRRD